MNRFIISTNPQYQIPAKLPRLNELLEKIITVKQKPEYHFEYKSKYRAKSVPTKNRNKRYKNKIRHKNCLNCKPDKIGGKICLRNKKRSIRNLIGDYFNELIIDTLQIQNFKSKQFLYI